MCKHQTYQTDMPAHGLQVAYEGKTVRLDPAVAGVEHQRRFAARQQCGSPFWMVWMIWPLLGLMKWAAPLVIGGATPLFAGLGTAYAAPIAAIALIIVGLVLIVRN